MGCTGSSDVDAGLHALRHEWIIDAVGYARRFLHLYVTCP